MPFGKAEQAAGLLALSNNTPVPKEYLDWYFEQGYVEAVHETSEEPVERNSPHAKVRITLPGWDFMQGR